jgi:hypothetical protein
MKNTKSGVAIAFSSLLAWGLSGVAPSAVEFAFGISSTMFEAKATGLATCDSGPKSGWQAVDKLEKMLTEKGWVVRRIKEDGGCYEVYALNEKGERVEAYFHPVTLAPVPTKR